MANIMTVGDLLFTICNLILTIIEFPFKILEWVLGLEISTFIIFLTIFLMIYKTCRISNRNKYKEKLFETDLSKKNDYDFNIKDETKREFGILEDKHG